MKKKDIFILCLFVLSFVMVFVFCYIQPTFVDDKIENSLLNDCIGRGVAGVAFIVVAFLLGYGTIFTKKACTTKTLPWCIPCLLVVIVNFPFSALIRGTAVIERYDLLFVFIVNCFLVALMEEVLFRGIVFSVLVELSNKKYKTAILLQSAVFALCHMLNLFSGSTIGDTILQVAYTFLIGIMLGCVFFGSKIYGQPFCCMRFLTLAAISFQCSARELSRTRFFGY